MHSFYSPLMKSPKRDADRTPSEQIQAHSEGFWITAISMNNPNITHVTSLATNLHNPVTNPHKKRHPTEFWNCFSLITGFCNIKKYFMTINFKIMNIPTAPSAEFNLHPTISYSILLIKVQNKNVLLISITVAVIWIQTTFLMAKI